MKRILLIRFGSLGDVVLTTPVIRAVREAFPEAYIAMLVGDRAADIFSSDPRLHEVIVFHRKMKGLSEIRRAAALIRERNFDVSVDMQRKFRSSLLAYLGGVKLRIGYHQPGGFLCNVKIPGKDDVHTVDQNLDLLKPLGIGTDSESGYTEADRMPEIMLSSEDRDYAQRMFDEWDLVSKSPIIGMFPGAGWRPKCWPAERFAAIGDLAAEKHDAGVIIFAGPGEADIVDSVAKNMKARAIMMKDRVTLRQLAAMIGKCDVFLSNDTGPMHISVAVGTATVGLFGPGNHIRFKPVGEKNALIRRDAPCSPCKHFTNKCEDNICMKLITVDEVWEAVHERLIT